VFERRRNRAVRASTGGDDTPARDHQRSAPAAGTASDLLFGTVPATGLALTDTSPLSNGTVILGYATAAPLERTTA
jgi:hypothetical protein